MVTSSTWLVNVVFTIQAISRDNYEINEAVVIGEQRAYLNLLHDIEMENDEAIEKDSKAARTFMVRNPVFI